jgi:hypothetical protein
MLALCEKCFTALQRGVTLCAFDGDARYVHDLVDKGTKLPLSSLWTSLGAT